MVILHALFILIPATVCSSQDQLAIPIQVLRLEQTEKVLENIDGQQWEVWLKSPATGASQPKTITHRATGFLLASQKGDGFLVTADHVAKHLKPTALLTVCHADGKMIQFKLRDLLFHERDFKRIEWVRHEVADVAVVRIKNTLQKQLGEKIPDWTYLDEKAVPKMLEQVLVKGFPHGMITQEPCSPLVITTNVSSGFLTLLRADTKSPATFFILGDPSIEALSGSPIIRPLEISRGQIIFSQEPRILGLVHGTISDNTGGKLAAAVPAKFIRELLEIAK